MRLWMDEMRSMARLGAIGCGILLIRDRLGVRANGTIDAMVADCLFHTSQKR